MSVYGQTSEGKCMRLRLAGPITVWAKQSQGRLGTIHDPSPCITCLAREWNGAAFIASNHSCCTLHFWHNFKRGGPLRANGPCLSLMTCKFSPEPLSSVVVGRDLIVLDAKVVWLAAAY